MSKPLVVNLPIDILDSIWPEGFNLKNWKRYPVEKWIESLDHYAEMGLLTVSGTGTDEDPIRFTANNPAAFEPLRPGRLTDLETAHVDRNDPSVIRLMARRS